MAQVRIGRLHLLGRHPDDPAAIPRRGQNLAGGQVSGTDRLAQCEYQCRSARTQFEFVRSGRQHLQQILGSDPADGHQARILMRLMLSRPLVGGRYRRAGRPTVE